MPNTRCAGSRDSFKCNRRDSAKVPSEPTNKWAKFTEPSGVYGRSERGLNTSRL